MIVKVLAIDPGNVTSGWVLMDGREFIEGCSDMPNPELSGHLMVGRWDVDLIACEWIQSYGMAVGKDVFHTCRWCGRFQECAFPVDFQLVYRRDVKLHLCNSTKAKDTNIRQAILDLYPAAGGGKTPQIGTKASPGPLYGISSHMWAAVGLALTVQEAEAVEAVH